MAPSSLIVEPPKRTGSRTADVDPDLLASILREFGPGHYVGDGFVYDTAKEASNAVAQYRRAIAHALDVGEHTVKTRVWGQDAKGNLLTDRTKKGGWFVAMSHDPNRPKRERNTNGATPAA